MRNGVLLTEKAPIDVIRDAAGTGCRNLEDAFLQLSSMQEQGIKKTVRLYSLKNFQDSCFSTYMFLIVAFNL